VSALQVMVNQSRAATYDDATKLRIYEEPPQGAAQTRVDADVRPAKRSYPAHSDRENSSQIIRNFFLSTGLVMPYDPADQALAANTITSVTSQPLTKVVKSIEEPDDGEEPHVWRGIYALEIPREVIFTKRINVQPSKLKQWVPQGISSGRQVQNEDE
jgi:hypothetical protein